VIRDWFRGVVGTGTGEDNSAAFASAMFSMRVSDADVLREAAQIVDRRGTAARSKRAWHLVASGLRNLAREADEEIPR
jgi:hypothetical protein